MAARTKKSISEKKTTPMLFDKTNYTLLGIGVALIIVGFLIMYLENEIDGFISLYIAPIMIVGGFGEIVYAIMKKSNETAKD